MNFIDHSCLTVANDTGRSLRDTIVGAWELVSCVETDVETGEIFLPMGPNPRGFILYTPDGYMSAQLSSPDRAPFESGDMYRGTSEDYVAAGMTYLAYSGPFRVDEVNRTIEHGMNVSLFPNWTGQRQLRVPELEGDTLVLATEHLKETIHVRNHWDHRQGRRCDGRRTARRGIARSGGGPR